MQAGKIIRLYEAVCGDCYRPEHAFTSRQDFEVELRDRGWKRTVALGWVCNGCAGNARVRGKD